MQRMQLLNVDYILKKKKYFKNNEVQKSFENRCTICWLPYIMTDYVNHRKIHNVVHNTQISLIHSTSSFEQVDHLRNVYI